MKGLLALRLKRDDISIGSGRQSPYSIAMSREVRNNSVSHSRSSSADKVPHADIDRDMLGLRAQILGRYANRTTSKD